MPEPTNPLPDDASTPFLGSDEAKNPARDQTPLPPPPVSRFKPGEAVPNRSAWILVREIGSGGFGEVWQTKHEWKKELGAVKFCTHPDARLQLVAHEKKVIVRVMKHAGDHPNIVPLLDYDLGGEVPWLMYEFVEGGTLDEAVLEWQSLPLPRRLGRAVLTMYALSRALKRVHRLDPPIVHRDLKPANILMARGWPRITDFGIGGAAVRAAAGSVGPRDEHSVELPTMLKSMGTFRYASPEQLFGSAPDPRDDVYALGIIAYQMVTGNLQTGPGTDAADTLREIGLPADLTSLIVRSVAMDPLRRPQTAREWERTLRTWLPEKHRKRPAPKPDPPPRAPRPAPTARPTPTPTMRIPSAPTPRPPVRAPTAPTSQSATFVLAVPGALLARPTGAPDAEWQEVAKIPARITTAPATEYCLRVKEEAIDRDLEGLRAVAGVPAITHLNLSWCEAVTDVGLSHLKDFRALRALDLLGCKRLTNAGLAHLARLTALEHLSLRWCVLVTDIGLAHVKRLGTLRSLDLMGCGELTDAGAAHLQRLTELRHLSLRWCEQLTDATLAHLGKLTNLRTLNLCNCTQFTDDTIAALQAALPACRIER